ncbi:hypothetical protein BGZ60DRAFT_387387 [Tricladium varicosporioides]|nr:hypothetical protein BGZ60DRAFT_387387 [Hymenoscyphus varicosporioides]
MFGDSPDTPPHPPSQTMSPTYTQNKKSSFSAPSGQQSNTGASRANGEGSGSSGSKPNFGQPGSSYGTKKFHEEYERAMQSVIDKDYDVARYGDPLAES